MANSDFLKNLQNAVEKGEFNSEAAKKITEITALADLKQDHNMEELNKRKENMDKFIEENGGYVAPVDKEVATAANTEYEIKMAELKERDSVMKNFTTLIEIEDMVKASIEDMFSFIDEMEKVFAEKLTADNKLYGDLYSKIEELNVKYKSLIN